MKHIPVDVGQLKFLVVGQPVPQMRDGQPYRDREWDLPMFNIDVTVIGDRAETIQLSVPEGGFPKELNIGVMIVPEQLVVVCWDKNGRQGQIVRARAIKVQGGAALKAAA
jgi:hypothetical protein